MSRIACVCVENDARWKIVDKCGAVELWCDECVVAGIIGGSDVDEYVVSVERLSDAQLAEYEDDLVCEAMAQS